MINTVLGLFGRKRVYICQWGIFTRRYDAVDRMANRPIHKNMSVAPPWAKAKIITLK